MKNLLLIAFVFFITIQSHAQVGVAINDNGAAPDASAMFDVSSTNQGFLVPRMTETQRDAINGPALGLLIFQTTTPNGFYFWNGFNWSNLTGAKLINDLTDARTVSSSVFLGENTGKDATATGNVGIGNGALFGLVTGINNIAIGAGSGSGTTGNRNILIGPGVATSATAASNELNIGNLIYGTEVYNAGGKIGIGRGNNTPSSTLDVGGSVSKPIVVQTSSYTATDFDHTIIFNHTSGSPTLTLPSAVGRDGRILIVRTTNVTSGQGVTIDPVGAETIDGLPGIVIGSGGTFPGISHSLTIQSDGGNWWVISGLLE